MATTNGQDVNTGSADFNLSDGTISYGFQLRNGTQLVEGRGSQMAASTQSAGGATYADATPFKRQVFENWIGGGGQLAYNKTYGGTGSGGDDTKYLDGDCDTTKSGYLLPGMARDMVYNTIAASKVPISDGIDPVAGDEFEMPRGVLPVALTNSNENNYFTASANYSVTSVRVLCLFRAVSTGSVALSVYIRDWPTQVNIYIYTITISLSTVGNYTGWKWITIPASGTPGAMVTGQLYSVAVFANTSNEITIGCYVGAGNAICPYFQLMTSATPFKYWANPLAKMEQLLNGTTYVNMAITTNALFNTAATATAGTAGASPERTLAGTYQGSVVASNNSKLIVFTSAGAAAWTAAAAASNAAPTNANDAAVTGFSPLWWNNKVLFVDATRTGIATWDGNFPASATYIINTNSIGQNGSFINNIFIFKSFLFVIKPEGVFQVYLDPSRINSSEVPRIIQLVTFPSVHQDTGKYFVIHQGMLFCNYRSEVWQITFAPGGTQEMVQKPQIARYRLTYFHYVNGLTSDGRNVYASWNNLGVYAMSGQSWHKMMDFYEQVAVEGQSSGLRWLPNPSGAPDYLFCGDGRTIVQQPRPNATSPYTQQIYANHQNKCGWLITSAWDGDVAEIQKYMQSIILRAIPSGWDYKISAVTWQTSTTPDFNTLQEKTWQEGLGRDSWVAPTAYTTYPLNVVTTKVIAAGTAIANTLAPTCWVASDFNNISYSSEKLIATTTDTTTTPATTDVLTNPVKLVNTAFIVYFWNPVAGQASTSGQAIMAIDSIVVKFLPILDYIPLYQLSIDVQSLIDEQKFGVTDASVNTFVSWVRQRAGAHSPSKLTIKTSEGIKNVNVFLTNPKFVYDPVDSGVGTDPLPSRIDLTLLAMDSEYPNV